MTLNIVPRVIWTVCGHPYSYALLSASGVLGLDHATRAATRAPSRVLPLRRALCTNWKKPRYEGSLSCEIPRCGRSHERSRDQKPSMVLTCTSQKPSRAEERRVGK